MKNWEYKVTDLGATEEILEKRLNELGAEGWELISTLSRLTSTPEKCIFKRVLSERRYPDEDDIADKQLKAEVENFLDDNF